MSFKPYTIYISILILFNLLILATPFIMVSDYSTGKMLHSAFSPTCHQLAARSYCYYPESGGIADCPKIYSRQMVFETEQGTAYKFPVCARDLPLYLAALLGGLAVYFTKWKDSSKTPNPIYFVIALIPIAFDGGTQFLGFRESTNQLRALTGMIAGFAFSFYFIPMINMFFLKKKEKRFNKGI